MNMLTRWYPIPVLILWFGIFAAFFVVLPEWLVWGYILILPSLTIYHIYRQQQAGQLKIRVSSIDIAIFLYVSLILISILSNDELPLSTDVYINEILFRVLAPFSVYWFVRVNPIAPDQMRLWVYFLAGLIVAETLLGFITLFAPLILPEAYQPRPVHLYKRATGSFVTPSTYVLTLFMGIVFVFYRIRRLTPSKERIALIIVLIIGMIGVIISQNRGGWLVLVLLTFIILYLSPELRLWSLGIFLFFIFATLILRPSFFSQSVDRLTEWRQVESRITMGLAGVEMFLEKPILGWGYATYDLHDWRYMRTIGNIEPTRYEISQATSHNTYITIASETGIIGLLIYIFPTAYLFWKSISAYFHKRVEHNWDLIFVLWLVVIIINIAAQFADFRFFPFVLGYWWLSLGLIANELNSNTHSQQLINPTHE